MKALEKDRTRRYETANGLAMDIERHLSNEPIVARPQSSAYRFQKLLRRNKLIFAAVGAVSAALAFGLVGILWQWRQAERNHQESEANLYAADMNRAAQVLDDLGPVAARGILERHAGMTKFAVVILLTLFGASPLLSHEMESGSTSTTQPIHHLVIRTTNKTNDTTIMKTNTILAMGLSAAIGLFISTQRASAQEHDEHSDHHSSREKVKVPDTLNGIWDEIHHQHKALTETVSAHKLADVHQHAFAIRDLAKALPSKVPAEHKQHITMMVKKLSQQAEDLDKAGDAGDQAKTEANLKKFDATLKEMKEMAGPTEAEPHKR
jgi:hypothetical protein